MLATIVTPVSERAPTDRSLTIWAQREVIPFMLDVRRTLNWEYQVALGYNSSGDGISTAVWTSPSIPSGRALSVQVDTVAVSTSGAAQCASFTVRGLFRCTSSVVAQIGTTTAVYSETTDGAIAVTLAPSGQTVVFSVQDNGVSPMAWKVHVALLITDEQ